MTRKERRAKADKLRQESYRWDWKAKLATTEEQAFRCRRRAADLRNDAKYLE